MELPPPSAVGLQVDSALQLQGSFAHPDASEEDPLHHSDPRGGDVIAAPGVKGKRGEGEGSATAAGHSHELLWYRYFNDVINTVNEERGKRT